MTAHDAPTAPAPQRRLAPCAALVIVTLLLGVARLVPWADEPWGHSMEGLVGARYAGRVLQSWQRLGFVETRGVPQVRLLPGETLGEPYLHHPPLLYWIEHAVVQVAGFHEAALRAWPILAAAANGAVLAWLVAMHLGLAWAALAAASYLAAPIGMLYGSMPSYESTVALVVTATVALHARLRARPRAYSWVVALFVFGAAVDWPVYFLLPALATFELVQPRAQRHLARLLVLAAAAVVSLGATIAVYAWGIGSLGATLESLWTTAQAAIGHDKDYGVVDWCRAQVAIAGAAFGWPLAVATALAAGAVLVRCARGATDPTTASLAALAIPPLLHLLCFRDHAFDHPLWWYGALPFAAFAGAWATRAIARHTSGRGRALVVVLVLASFATQVAFVFRDHAERRTTEFRDVAELINGFADRDDLVMSPELLNQETFWLRAWYCERVDSIEHFDRLVARRATGAMPADEMFFLAPHWMTTRHASLFERVKAVSDPLPGLGDVVWRVRR